MFDKSFIAFYKELNENNHKDWFDQNRSRYEKEVKKPLNNFANALLEKVKLHEPYITQQAKDCLFRINRDIRFSQNKNPYKTHAAVYVNKYGRKDAAFPGFYVHIEPEFVQIASGVYMASKPEIYAIRWALSEDAEPFRKLYKDKNFIKYFKDIKGDKNVRVEPEFKEAVAFTPEILFKQFYYEANLPTESIYKSDFLDLLMEHYLAAKPLNNYLGSLIEKARM